MTSAINPINGPQVISSMNASIVVETLLSRKGQHVPAHWRRTLEGASIRAAFRHLKIEKETIAHVRTGVDYANTAAVAAEVEAGTRGTDVNGKPIVAPLWNGKGEWVAFPFIARHKDKGTEYVRMMPASFDNLRPSVQWYLNGVPVDFAAVSGYLTAKEMPSDTPPRCFTVKADDVVSIG